jgi:hypothetical protein
MLFPCPGIPKKYKCVRKEIPCPTGSLPEIQQVVRECEECPDPAIGFPSDPECVYNTPDCSEAIAGCPPCISDPPNLCISKPTDPGGGGGGSVAAFKCVTTEQVCPPGSLNAGSRIRVESRVCESCNKGQPQQPPTQTSPGKIFNGVVLAPAIRKSESLCQYNSPTACLGACPPVVGGGASTSQTQLQSFCNEEPQNVSVNNPGLEEDGVATPSPAQSVSLPSQQLLETQERNAVRINPNKQLIQEDFNELKNRESVQKFYHPEYNLFNLKTDRSVRFVANTSYLNIFKTEVDASISKAFSLQKSNSTWSEKDI